MNRHLRYQRIFLPLLALLVLVACSDDPGADRACESCSTDADVSVPDADTGDTIEDIQAPRYDQPHEPIFIPGNFGSLNLSPDRRMLLVRSAEPDDEWDADASDVSGSIPRPRLHLLDSQTGELTQLTANAGRTSVMRDNNRYAYTANVVFVPEQGALFTDSGTDEPLLFFVDRNGSLDLVTPRPGQLELHHNTVVTRSGVFMPSTHTIYRKEGFSPVAASRDGRCIIGSSLLDNAVEFQLWVPSTNEVTPLFRTGETAYESNAQISSDCSTGFVGHTNYSDEATLWILELDAPDTNAQRKRVGSTRQTRFSPDEQSLWFYRDEEVHRLSLAPTRRIRTTHPGFISEVSPDGSLGFVLDDQFIGAPTSYCSDLRVVDLDTGEMMFQAQSHTCEPRDGKRGFSADGQFVFWTDNDDIGYFAPTDSWEARSYGSTEGLSSSGRVTPDGDWLLAPFESDDDDVIGPKWLAKISLTDPKEPADSLYFEGEHPFRHTWRNWLRFSADNEVFVFPHGKMPHSGNSFRRELCNLQLRIGRLGHPDSSVFLKGVTHVEIDAAERLVVVTNAPESFACRDWEAPDSFEAGIHIFPRHRWHPDYVTN